MTQSLSLAKRLFVAALINVTMVIIVVAIGFYSLEKINTQVEKLTQKDWVKASMATQISSAANRVAVLTFAILQDPSRLAEQKAEIDKHRQNAVELLQKLDALIYSPRGKDAMADLKAKRGAFAETYPKVISLIEAGKRDEAARLFQADGLHQLNAYLASVDALLQLHTEQFEAGGVEARDVASTARILLFLLMALSVTGSVILSVWLTRGVLTPLGGEPAEAQAVLSRIANGDLTQQVPLKVGDQHSLLSSVSQMQASLIRMVSSLHHDAEKLNSAAENLASASTQVAQGSSFQSDAASSMAASVEELSVSVSQVSESAEVARTECAETSDLSIQGDHVIEATVREMGKIENSVRTAANTVDEMGERSKRISSVVQVIREVAEQTNLLALNAAIEAARAGEAGRGFAVVADEVRKLAERTESATAEIGAIINDVQTGVRDAVSQMEQAVIEVSEGVAKAQEAREAMHSITAGSGKVLGAVNNISSALEEQTTASHEVAANVESIAQMAEENSAAAGAAAETAHELKTVAASVQTSVAWFRV